MKRRWRKVGAGVLGLVMLWCLAVVWVPFPHHKLREYPQNVRLLDAEGHPLRRLLSDEGLDADWVSLSETGDWAGAALVSVEDKRFFRHWGVDPIAVARAMGQNVWKLKVVSGASTLSTQVIKMIEPRPRTLWTKGIEAFRACQLEWHYDKAFILEQYLNRAPFGGNRQGIATASRRYYGKEPAVLSAGEAALLVGLPQLPERYRPDRYPEMAEARRVQVLRRMRADGLLKERPILDQGAKWVEPEIRALHFTEWVRRQSSSAAGEIHTTLDSRLQALLEAVVEGLDADPAYDRTDGVGMLLMEARTGAIRAWVGNRDVAHPAHGHVDTVTRRRAPGSALKPFAYALGMERGWLTPETRLEDSPRSFRDYQPRNMDQQWSGDVSAADALVRSLNIPALHIVEKVGVESFLRLLRTVGIPLWDVGADEAGLGSVLGGGMETSLLELVGACRVFAAEGKWVRPYGVAGGGSDELPVFTRGSAYWISRMLSGPERDGWLYGHEGEVGNGRFAFKTGTSHGHRDAWCVAWNGEWVLGVWVGRMDGGRVPGLSGAGHAVPIVGKVAEELFSGTGGDRWLRPPPEWVKVDGKERMRGMTDPRAEREQTKRAGILSPPPAYAWRGVEEGDVRIRLEVTGAEGEEVHWFLNGKWLGAFAGEGAHHLKMKPGRHRLRAVFADGRSEERRISVGRM